MSKKAGVKDIALKAGISTGTVDRVLNNRGRVSEKTKEKVLRIAKELGYQPNLLAKTLATRKATRIAIIIPDSSDENPYWEKPVKGIRKASDELHGFNVEIIFKHFDASNEESFKKILEEVCSENLDGVILNPVFKTSSLHYISIFNKRDIPYAFIDVNISGVGNLGYFGQDAAQSGIVSASLMASSIPENAEMLIVKLSKGKVFSHHIESRVSGFLKHFNSDEKSESKNIQIVEIDLQECDEPKNTLSRIFVEGKRYSGVFVPNSRVFEVADFLEGNSIDLVTVGYDLLDKNIEHLKKGSINYLISQKPEEQAYSAIQALFNYLVTKKEVAKTTYSPIDIIIKENIDYYK